MRQLRLLRLSTPIVSIVSTVSCKFLHGDIDDIANFAIFASAFFPPSISCGLNPDIHSIIYYVYNTEPSKG
jgi:hypothetical protein